ncbi:unnamed protein product [[Actinomadura] parvosata subsp. kistnae]|uniref:DNA primase n=1 Tax=[Actinomadura] parvosata subsp. kistnae TaxID=1909395 RepID=A0A1V0A9V3_9ACTN|nr:hypothetical protein [Nonomuraea sp. ATCC 55076]AQZ66978.1 hypothetical protein BKM31_40950 [Nonomuraea sp. ATCC 55076]SPL94856.1 unnamed protein product [Actinomadura parvosata subsp. kistnae]
MSNKLRIAFALLAGYFLGRRRKLRMAAALAAAGLAGRARAGGGGGGLLSQGIKALTSSAEVGQVADRLRGDLLQVGKAAAVAAAGRQIDSLSDKLHERAEALRSPGERDATEDQAEDQAEDEAQGDAQDGPEEEPEEEPEDEEKGAEASEGVQRRPRILRRTRRTRRGSTDD